MEPVELPDADATRAFLLDGFFLQRAAKPAAAGLKPMLELAFEIASQGSPLLPTGVLADFAAVALGATEAGAIKEYPAFPGWPANLLRQYEDFLLAKLHADWTFERAGDAIRRYQGRDRAKGLAYVVRQFRERARLGGVDVSPAVVRGLLRENSSDLMAKTLERLGEHGPHPVLKDQYEAVVAAARRTPDLLGADDIQALEQRTALADMGEYVAHRQIVRTAAKLEAALPRRPVAPRAGRKEVPTRVHDEDQYPVGGYSSIANRGSIESLLHSQLAYMEPAESPDLFDVKFIRDELFYYARDENQFLRRRRVFLFVLDPSLLEARIKDPDLPVQRIVLVQSLVVAVVRRLADWLTADAIRFEILLPAAKDRPALADEARLFETLFLEMRAAGTVAVARPTAAEAGDLPAHAARLAAGAQVHALAIGVRPTWPDQDAVVAGTLAVAGPRPVLTDGRGEPADIDTDDAFEHWAGVARRLLELWV